MQEWPLYQYNQKHLQKEEWAGKHPRVRPHPPEGGGPVTIGTLQKEEWAGSPGRLKLAARHKRCQQVPAGKGGNMPQPVDGPQSDSEGSSGRDAASPLFERGSSIQCAVCAAAVPTQHRGLRKAGVILSVGQGLEVVYRER